MKKEIYKPIIGYEGLYEISETGKVFSHHSKRTLKRCGDEYGFHVVRLHSGGKAANLKVFELWKTAFPSAIETDFKGAKTIIYR
ncbi:NUMOD4 domain-containing protein [Rossellomorea aquimaris]|uniref:NUMOD4 domain-containing protein n=1 Tax=Rossellomorea aquimaris TaxID=189382 RepID=A0A5D4UI21_9BACI|nr:NUMOD4 domain-containing protein [Rossellomorea aquimaris]TYS77619.1 hypothetical protein FZD05_13415 [Rossellomorea aquimaris]TYS86801.1 hypothetical protein FZC85_07310 [Rossellomorea aquimaris]TYS87854.1 hypothetical protein FZC88_16580 [Rossellomorea aquimaris]